MKGHVHKRVRALKNGKTNATWYVVIELPRKQDSKRNQKWYGGYSTRREAEMALGKLLGEITSNQYIEPIKLTISEFVKNTWLPSMKSQLKPSTFDSYQRNLELHVLPFMGQLYLQDLNAQKLNELYALLLENGNKNCDKGLSPKTVRYIHTTIHKLLEDAIDLGLLIKNPADRAKPPRLNNTKSSEMKSWSALELATFLRCSRDHRFYVAFHLGAMTGMRRGEILGLRWNDIDLKSSRISIRQSLISVAYQLKFSSPKSHQARTIDLDSETLDLFRAHKEAQLIEKLSWGIGYQNNDLVFGREDGSPVHPDSFSQAFDVAVRNSQLPRIRLHDLRHTHASIALQAGIPVKVISERLGHENPAFTLKQYVHVIPGMQKEAASLVASLVRDAESVQKF